MVAPKAFIKDMMTADFEVIVNVDAQAMFYFERQKMFFKECTVCRKVFSEKEPDGQTAGLVIKAV